MTKAQLLEKNLEVERRNSELLARVDECTKLEEAFESKINSIKLEKIALEAKLKLANEALSNSRLHAVKLSNCIKAFLQTTWVERLFLSTKSIKNILTPLS